MADDHQIDVVATRDESDGISSDSEQDKPSQSTTPPSLEEFDRWQAHISLQSFGEGLNAAAKAIFPNDGRSRYSKVYVLMLGWEDKESHLSAAEGSKLLRIFKEIYHFDVEAWTIPSEGSKTDTYHKIADFISLGGDNDEHLKILYYAGQTRLIKNKELAWTRSVDFLSLTLLLRWQSKADISQWTQEPEPQVPNRPMERYTEVFAECTK